MHVSTCVEVRTACQYIVQLEPTQVVGHQQPPVHIVAHGMGQLVQHLVGDQQHPAIRTDSQPSYVMTWKSSNTINRDRARSRQLGCQNRQPTGKGIGNNQPLILPDK